MSEKVKSVRENSKILHEGLLKLAGVLKGSSKEENNSHWAKATKHIQHNQTECFSCGRDTQAGLEFCSISCQGDFYGI
jgi:hypothetical protein